MSELADLGEQSFVSLTTFRKSGEGVPTPLWIVPHGDGVAFWTPGNTGKVKRLRNNPLVELRPCDRRGTVAHDAPVETGQAALVSDPAVLREVEAALKRKYGFQYRIARTFEKVLPSRGERIVIAVT